MNDHKLRFQSKDRKVYPEWKYKKLSDIYEFSQGLQVPVEEQSTDCSDGKDRFIRIIDITQSDEPPRYVSNPSGKGHVEKDDIFFVRYGAVGAIGYGFKGTIANNLFKLIPKENLCSKFMYYQFLTPKFQLELTNLSASTSMPAINFKALNELVVQVPDVSEQQYIADFLSTVDEKIKATRNELDGWKTVKKGLLQQMFC